GQRRFDIERTEVQADQLVVAEARWRPEPDDAPLEDGHADLAVLLEALRQHPMVRSLGMNDAVGGRRALADQLAYLLPFQPEHKIELLQLEDVDLRLSGFKPCWSGCRAINAKADKSAGGWKWDDEVA